MSVFTEITIPTNNSHELAKLIYNNSYDWAVVLDWIEKITAKHGIIFNSNEVAELIVKEYINDSERK